MEIRIEHDLYDVAWRLRAIDPRYEVYFDTGRQKYIIKAFGILQVVLPFPELDQRALDYVRYTRKENAEKILADIDKHNDGREKEEIEKAKDEIENEYARRLRLSRYDKGDCV